MALIGRLPDTLEDRAILIPMRRKAPGEQIDRLLRSAAVDLHDLARKVARWAQDLAATLPAEDPPIPAELRDRTADNWRPLFAIADSAGGEWPKRARAAALELSGVGAADDGSLGHQLLADIREILAGRQEAAIESLELVGRLTSAGPALGEVSRGRPLTACRLSQLLRPYGIKPKQIRLRGEKTRATKQRPLLIPSRIPTLRAGTPGTTRFG